MGYNNVPVETVERFIMKRNGCDTPLHTVKIVFKNHEALTSALRDGVALGNVIHNVEKMKNTRRVMQCFNCKAFGHPSYQCQKKEPRCKYCGDGHKDDQCKMRDPTRDAFCCNCRGNHIATSNICPVYKERLARRSTGTLKYNGY